MKKFLAAFFVIVILPAIILVYFAMKGLSHDNDTFRSREYCRII